jgi:hypothetical protein
MATATPIYDLTIATGPSPDIQRLYDNVQAVVPAVSLPVITLQTWNAIEEFYLRSTLRREEVLWTMGSGVDEVDFNPFDADWLVAWILDVGPAYGVSSAANTTSVSGRDLRIDPPSLLRDIHNPVPTTQRQGSALLALKPVSLDIEFPPMLWMQWFDVILDGVLFRLYGMPSKPYSSTQLATYHGTRFRGGIRRARDYAQRQYTDGGGRWCFPYFSRGHRKQ